MGHREFLLCDNKLAQILHRRLSDTRMRPPQSGLVQVALSEALLAIASRSRAVGSARNTS
jgi:hypothetical protein